MAATEGAGVSRRNIAAWPLEAGVVKYSSFHDAVNEVCSDTDESIDLEEGIRERYNQVTSLCEDESGWCYKYAYYTENADLPCLEEHKDIVHMVGSVKMFDRSKMSKYLQLNETSQDKLYIILSSALSIWVTLQLNIDSPQKWIKRPCKPHVDDLHSCLKDYGSTSEVYGNYVMDILARGRSREEMKDRIREMKHGFMGHDTLHGVWERALKSGMMNGSGRTAVYVLLDSVIGLLSGLNENYPQTAVLSVTSPNSSDACSVTSSSCSKSDTRSDVKSPPPKRKRRDSMSDSDFEENVSSQMKRVTWPKDNRKSDDMRVVSIDKGSGAAKYVIVVEIHSRGQNLLKAQQKFTKELVHVLQLQSKVYGLLFSDVLVRMYRASRSTTGQIRIAYHDYILHEGHAGYDVETDGFGTFGVAKFQQLIMDIFSCLVDGMENIDV